MNCKICGATADEFMSTSVLKKYAVTYYKCRSCSFIQTEEPYWLDEAYSSAISGLDIGLIQRNEAAAGILQSVIYNWFDKSGQYVDYGGGYGMLVRMMRDRGYNFYRFDTYCDNLFAKGFDVEDQPDHLGYELLTAFEVFEHLVNPVQDFQKMLKYSRSIFFSTELQPNIKITPQSWWYILPETGQHISLYSSKSLHVLAEQNGLHYYSGKNNMHLFTEHQINSRLFTILTDWRSSKLYNILARTRLKSLLNEDYIFLKDGGAIK